MIMQKQMLCSDDSFVVLCCRGLPLTNYTENLTFGDYSTSLSENYVTVKSGFSYKIWTLDQHGARMLNELPPNSPPVPTPYLHGGEISDVVKLKDHLHVTFGEALVAPAHIVVPWPHAVYVTVEKIIQTPGSIRQLAEALCQSSGGYTCVHGRWQVWSKQPRISAYIFLSTWKIQTFRLLLHRTQSHWSRHPGLCRSFGAHPECCMTSGHLQIRKTVVTN